MSEQDLMSRFLSDMSCIGLPVYEVDVVFRPYSKTYFGRYYPTIDEKKNKPRIALYPYEEDESFMDYYQIVKTGIHEFSHHLQYVSGSYVRRKGVMHDQNFWNLYNFYVKRAVKLGVLEERGEVVGS